VPWKFEFWTEFEFVDLRFQPKKSPKPILFDVSGRINSGAPWGVMGASGAGKCG
jgi:ABC-type methionine transport system ATPase subunit